MAPPVSPASRVRDQQHFHLLWTDHYRSVYAFALRRVATPEAAHDVVSETFLTAWRRRSNLPHGLERPWLLGIARRAAANDRRSAARFDALVDRLQTAPGALSTEAAPDSAPDQTAVAAAFDALSPDDREALSLVVWDDLSPREAAIVLGIAAPRFSVRLHRAKKRLHARLADLRQQPPDAPRSPSSRVRQHPDSSHLETH